MKQKFRYWYKDFTDLIVNISNNRNGNVDIEKKTPQTGDTVHCSRALSFAAVYDFTRPSEDCKDEWKRFHSCS